MVEGDRAAASVNATADADALERDLQSLGTPERAVHERAYLKSDLVHHGATVWEIRRVIGELVKRRPNLTHDDVVALAGALWSKPVHERRMAAVALLERRSDLLDARDLRFVERLIRESHTWAFVDRLAGDVAGSIVAGHPDAADTVDRWGRDPDFWVRRSALLSMLQPLKRGAPFDRFAGLAEAMLDEKEFFIRKAIGWVLRDVAKTRGDEVHRWLLPRARRASGVTIREAVKYLEPEQRAAILAARTGSALTDEV